MKTEALEVTLLNSPQDWDARMELIRKACAKGEAGKAGALIEAASFLPDDEAGRVFCAQVLARTNTGKARAVLEEVVGDGRAHPEASLALARVLHAEGDDRGAHEQFGLATAGNYALEELGFERAMAGEMPEGASADAVEGTVEAPDAPGHAPGAVFDEAEDGPVVVTPLRPPGQEAGNPVALTVPHADSRQVRLPEITSQPVVLPPPSGPTGTVMVPPMPWEIVPDGLPGTHASPFGDHSVAEEALRAQQRKTKAASLTIGVLLHAVLLLLFSVLVIWAAQEKPPELVTYIGDPDAPRTMEKPVVQRNVRMQTSPSSAETRMITSTAPSAVFLPVIEKYVESDAVGLGGIGQGGLGGLGQGNANFQVPYGMRSRCNKSDRMKRIHESGGSIKVESAVVKALNWLASVQNSDGSWTNEPSAQVGVTGLALLCYLGHCETVSSRSYGVVVAKAIDYLLDVMRDADMRAAQPLPNARSYAFAIALYALSETYSMHKTSRAISASTMTRIKTVVREAARRIISAQASDGGWNYAYNGSSVMDTSVVGWQVQALKAAQTTGISISGLDRCLRNAEDYFKKAQGPNGSFTYRANNHKASLGGVGTLCTILLGQPESDVVKKGLEFVASRHPKGGKASRVADPYEWYYNMFAAQMAGGKVWKQVNDHAMDAYLDSQEREGFWKFSGTAFHGKGQDADIYMTTLCTLALEVYYRYLPSAK